MRGRIVNYRSGGNMRKTAHLVLVLGLLVFAGKQQPTNPGCPGAMRLSPDHVTVYLQYERETADGKAYVVALHNNINAPISVETPCAECKRTPCQTESAAVFQPLYRVGGIDTSLSPNSDGDVVCERSIAPGESAEFTVPKKYSPRNSSISLRFSYGWEEPPVSSFHGEPLHYVGLSGPVANVSDVPF
jgi:hypothetical protein